MSKTACEIVVKSVTWFMILDQIRQQATAPEDESLTKSIAEHGVLQPLGARSSDGRLVWGHRRLRCAIAAGLKEVPTVLLHKDMTEGEYLTLQMLENVQRSDLCPFDMWQGCVRLLEANKDKGWKLQDVAKAICLDPGTVTKIMSPSKAIPPVVEALKAGKIGLTTVYTITKGGSEGEQERLLNLSLAGISRDALEKEVRRKKTVSTPPEQQQGRHKCVVPGKAATLQIVAESAMSLGGMIEVAQEWVKRAKRAAEQGWDGKTLERACQDEAKKG